MPRKSNKEMGDAWEQEVRDFLKEKLCFEDVDGGDNFLINGIQVDACGGHEDTLIIIECKHKSKCKEQGEDNIREYIKILRGDREPLEEGFKKHPNYSRYKSFRYVICTKNYKTRKTDFEFANLKPHIHVWDENFLDYYKDLYGLIGKYAKYDLLGEMRIKPSETEPFLVPAFKMQAGNKCIYTFLIDPKKLLEISYVARRETRKQRNYQRMINKEKINKIASYINEGNMFPNSLIISLSNPRFFPKQTRYDPINFPAMNISYGFLKLPNDYRSCWIIDGQHRLYAFMKTDKEKYFNVPVTAFENLDQTEQCKFFLDINTTQKPVPPDLVWDLNGDMFEAEDQGKISRIAKELNNKGALFHKIYYPSLGIKTKPLLKLSGICISLKRSSIIQEHTISRIQNYLFDNDIKRLEKNVVSALNEYLASIENTFQEDWKLGKKGFILTDGGISVFIYLFEKIISRFSQEGKVPKKEDYIHYLKPVKCLFDEKYSTNEELNKLRRRTSGEGSKRDILIEFIKSIQGKLNDERFGKDLESSDDKFFTTFEEKLKEFINQVLIEPIGRDWFDKLKGINKAIYDKAFNHFNEHGLKDLSKLYMQIGTGECKYIIENNPFQTYFEPIFTKNNYFYNWKEFVGALSQVVRMRNTQKIHAVGVSKKLHDDEQLKINLDKINGCIDAFLKLKKNN